jgi:hypothetical protein
LIHQLLSKNPNNRPQSAEEVVKRVRAISEELATPLAQPVAEEPQPPNSTNQPTQPQVIYVPIEITAQPQGSAFADLDVATAETSLTAQSKAAPKPVRKKSGGVGVWIAAGLAVILAVAAIVGGVNYFYKGKRENEAKTEEPPEPISKPKNVSKPITQEPTDPDYKAAKYVLSVGGKVLLLERGDWVRTLADMPKDRATTITRVSLPRNKNVTDEGLANLKDCKDIESLDLLETGVTNAGLANFKNYRNLKQLNLQGVGVTDAGLKNFEHCENLDQLILHRIPLTDEGLGYFKRCNRLIWLDLSATKITDKGLVSFKGSTGLKFLILSLTQITDAGLEHFKDNKKLERLNIGSTKVTDEGLVNFKDCKNLTILELEETDITDTGLANFKDCKNLNLLNVLKTKVTPKFLEEFHTALPKCKIVHDGGTIEPIDPDHKAAEYVLSVGGWVRVNRETRQIKALANLPTVQFALTDISLTENNTIRDDQLVVFKSCKDLTFIDLTGTGVTNAGLANFKGCENLTRLELNQTRIGDDGLANFKDCKNLIRLNLANTNLTNAGLAYFKECKNLTHAGLHYTKITDAGLENLKNCPNLAFLSLHHTQITDAGLAYLKQFKNLSYIHVVATNVGAIAIEEFHKALPNCKIVHDGGTVEPVDPDRKAAEYVLSIGGIVGVKMNASGKERAINGLTDLPKDPFTLRSVNLQGNNKVTDDGLLKLNNCRNLTHLLLTGTTVTDEGLVNFIDCENLVELGLDGTQVTDKGLAYFKNCTNLQTLGLYHCPGIRGDGLAHFKDCKNIWSLGLSCTQNADSALSYFKEFKKVKRLYLSCPVTDNGLAYFKDFDLTLLELESTNVTDLGLEYFKNFKNLGWLVLLTPHVTDKGLAFFKDCKNLGYLLVGKTMITPKYIEEFSIAHPRCKIVHDGDTIEPK